MSAIDKAIEQMKAAGMLSKDQRKTQAEARKKQAREERRKERQRLSEARKAEIWEDRDGKARPTAERRAKGRFTLRDGDDAGVTVAWDEEATMLDVLHRERVIDSDQRQGGLDLAALFRRMQMVSPGRSCLDFSPAGFDSSEEADPQEQRDSRDRAELYIACGMVTWAELRRVCVEDMRPMSVERLKQGLSVCAKFWG